jgi:hypothetical protein
MESSCRQVSFPIRPDVRGQAALVLNYAKLEQRTAELQYKSEQPQNFKIIMGLKSNGVWLGWYGSGEKGCFSGHGMILVRDVNRKLLRHRQAIF